MSIEIDIQTGDASWPLAKGLLSAIFPPDAATILPTGPIEWAQPDFRVLIEEPGQGVICHVGIHRRIGTWKGRKVRIGGIGGVATHPDHRQRGYAGIGVRAAIQTLRDEEVIDFALLVCRPQNAAFYEKRGWHPFNGELYVAQKGERIRFDAMSPYVFDIRHGPCEGVIDLCGLPW